MGTFDNDNQFAVRRYRLYAGLCLQAVCSRSGMLEVAWVTLGGRYEGERVASAFVSLVRREALRKSARKCRSLLMRQAPIFLDAELAELARTTRAARKSARNQTIPF